MRALSIATAGLAAAALLAFGCATPQPTFVDEHDSAMQSMCAQMIDPLARCRCEAGHLESQAVQQPDPYVRGQLSFAAVDKWMCAQMPDRARKLLEQMTHDPRTPDSTRMQAQAKLSELGTR